MASEVRAVAGCDPIQASGAWELVTIRGDRRLNGTLIGLTTTGENVMTMDAGAYDISRMYRSGSHSMKDDAGAAAAAGPSADVDRMSESASAILACGEYLATAKEMPSDQREAVDMLRREIRTLVYGLSVLTAVQARSHRVE